jgi:DNA recombination protein RmuC
MAELEARLDAEDRLGRERLQALAEQRQELRRDFETLAAKIFDAKTERFTRMSQEGLGRLLQPVREQLKDFREKLESVHLDDARERASLREELKQLRTLNQQIGDEALNLTRALKGDTRVQGSWGELVLERVLEQSGLRKGIEYHTQTSFRDAEQRLLRPDVIVHLPQGKDVVIDSKVSLVAYERYVSAGDESERARRLREHLLAVRRHMESLSAKDYSGLPDIRSLDLVLMFMPMEGAAMTAFQNDERLFQDAFDKRIVLVTPTTLLATLRTVESIWRHEHQNRNARAIAERAAALHDKLCGFVEEMERLGRQMTLAQGAYDKAMDRLTRGSGNLVRQARRFVDLGVAVKKTLPEVGLDVTEEERKKEQTD